MQKTQPGFGVFQVFLFSRFLHIFNPGVFGFSAFSCFHIFNPGVFAFSAFSCFHMFNPGVFTFSAFLCFDMFSFRVFAFCLRHLDGRDTGCVCTAGFEVMNFHRCFQDCCCLPSPSVCLHPGSVTN